MLLAFQIFTILFLITQHTKNKHQNSLNKMETPQLNYKEIEPPKKKWWQIVKSILLFVGKLVINNQKGFKGTENTKKVDQAAEILDKL